MKEWITYETLRLFAYSNDHLIQGPIRGIALEFFGLNAVQMIKEDPDVARMYAERGVAFVIPYCNPWAWMNRQAVRYTDEVVRALMARYGLPDSTPVVSTGGSMGGLAALVYMRYASLTPCACVTNCPVCDLPYHYTERPDLPRTLVSAFGEYECGLEEALRRHSPLHLADSLPKAKYHLFHCAADPLVNKGMHSDRLAAALSGEHDVTYDVVDSNEHCKLPEDMLKKYRGYILSAIDEGRA
jgi:hypothetical protein